MEKAKRVTASRYCCAINCSNNSATSIDPRTQRPVRFHSFPDPTKDKERCSKWIINLRRSDLNLNNICYKRVCSIHFEPTAYNCPKDISSSRLIPVAVPTIVTCPNPPPSVGYKRSPPKERQSSLINLELECDEDEAQELDLGADVAFSEETLTPDSIAESCQSVRDRQIFLLKEKLQKAEEVIKGYQKTKKKFREE